MGGKGSGGHNRKSLETHLLQGSFRPSRHGRSATSTPEDVPLSRADRTRVLAGLSVGGRRLATALLDRFEGWDAATLHTVRQFALSCERLWALQAAPVDDPRVLHAELRANLLLLKSLHLERSE